MALEGFRLRVELALRHRALGGATPAELYFGIEPALLSAVHGPRARPGECPTAAGFAIGYFEPEQRRPILFPTAA